MIRGAEGIWRSISRRFGLVEPSKREVAAKLRVASSCDEVSSKVKRRIGWWC
ncbi:MAG: hypothetical protein QW794_02085 [Thermosphaera sp.]